MSSLRRSLNGAVLVHHLTEDKRTIDQALLARHGRSSRTLVKEGSLRLTLIAMAEGGDLAVHRAAGSVTMHVVEGEILFSVLGRDYTVKVGDILVLAPGVEHSARSERGGVFLLTVVHPDAADVRSATE